MRLFYENLRVLLQKKKKTYIWLAKKTGVSANVYYEGKNKNVDIPFNRAVVIARVLDVGIEDLCSDVETGTGNPGKAPEPDPRHLDVLKNCLPKISLEQQRAIYRIMTLFLEQNKNSEVAANGKTCEK